MDSEMVLNYIRVAPEEYPIAAGSRVGHVYAERSREYWHCHRCYKNIWQAAQKIDAAKSTFWWLGHLMWHNATVRAPAQASGMS